MPEGTPAAQERLELVRLTAREIPRAEASDLELLREGRSYTADTVELLHRTYPGDELFLLMGTDMFLAFPQWREPETICRYATLVVMLRGAGGAEAAAGAAGPGSAHPEKAGWKGEVFEKRGASHGVHRCAGC